MELSGKNIFITGSTGFIGSYVTKKMLSEGAEVFALVRKSSKGIDLLPKEDKLHIIYGDMSNISNIKLPVSNIDIILHFAWGGVNRKEIDLDEVQRENVDASLELLRLSKNLGCKLFVDAGSRVEYGITKDGYMKEDMPCNPVNAYGRAKLDFYNKAKELCREYNINYYHLRFFSVYGYGDHPWSIISTLTTKLPKGEKVELSACMHKWNFMDIDDASRAVIELCKYSDEGNAKAHIVNIASKDTRVLKEFVEEIHRLCGLQGELEFGSFVQAKEGALSICPDIEELKKLTGYTWKEEVSFEEGIKGLLSRRIG